MLLYELRHIRSIVPVAGDQLVSVDAGVRVLVRDRFGFVVGVGLRDKQGLGASHASKVAHSSLVL